MGVDTITEVRQYLTFKLGDEVYALDVAKVREVLDFTTVTKIPRTPEFMRGVINLRGNVVPVVDLRLGFGLTKTERTVNTCIIVEEVIDLEPDQIEPAPRIGTGIRTDFIRGMGKRDTRFIMILDIDKVFSTDDLALLRAEETAPA